MDNETIKTIVISAAGVLTTLGLAYIAARWHKTDDKNGKNGTSGSTPS